MNEVSAKILNMRDQQLTYGLRAVAILGLIAVSLSIFRTFILGWHMMMCLHIALYLVVLGMVVWGRRMSFSLKAGIVVAMVYLLGVVGLVYWGLAAFGLLALFSFSIISTILFGVRAGIISSIAGIATSAIVGACVCTGIITFHFNAGHYLSSPVTWLAAILAMVLSAGVIVVTLGTLNMQIEDLVHVLQKQNKELLEKNQLLEKEITERIRAEEEQKKLERRLQLVKKMEAIGTLAGGVAHDLNNILVGIVGYPELMLLELPQESSLRGPLESIKKTGIKAAALVNDMLTVARNGVVEKEIVNLNSIVLEYCDSPEFETMKLLHQGVDVKLLLEQDLMNVRGSPIHLSQVVMNLVLNAAEAMPAGGQIHISTENRCVNCRTGIREDITEGDYAILCVADAGIGIPHDSLDKIFEPFFSKKKIGRSGTGLGMAVVWSAVKDHGGYIDVDSVEGKGTKFTIYFPITNEPLTPVKPASIRAELMGSGESILIVDDVAEQREIASEILAQMGYSVRSVSSGEKALECLRQDSADLLILDMIMAPGMDGLEVYKKIISLYPGQKVLLSTGFAESRRVKEAQQLGAEGCLKKPYLIDEIGLAVRSALGNGVGPR